MSLFAPEYDSRQPVHPDRAFVGRDQVRANWSAVFAGVPDFRAEICKRLRFLGVDLDEAANDRGSRTISSPDSRIAVEMIPTNEEEAIARHTAALMAR